MIPKTALVEQRRWVPKYRVSIISEEGKVLARREFWRKRRALSWANSFHVYER